MDWKLESYLRPESNNVIRADRGENNEIHKNCMRTVGLATQRNFNYRRELDYIKRGRKSNEAGGREREREVPLDKIAFQFP